MLDRQSAYLRCPALPVHSARLPLPPLSRRLRRTGMVAGQAMSGCLPRGLVRAVLIAMCGPALPLPVLMRGRAAPEGAASRRGMAWLLAAAWEGRADPAL